MTDRAKRDRPAKTPSERQCGRCNQIFIGEKWHEFCSICVREVADKIAVAQGIKAPVSSPSGSGK